MEGMNFRDCMNSGGHSYYETGLRDSIGRDILRCSKCDLPVYIDEHENVGLLKPGDERIFDDTPRMRPQLTLVGA